MQHEINFQNAEIYPPETVSQTKNKLSDRDERF